LTTVEQIRVGGHQVGLPEGVFLAPLPRRLGAFAIDALIPYVMIIAGLLVGRSDELNWLAMILYVVAVLWLVLLLVMVAVKAAGPGMQLLRLQIVGMHDGRPIGFGRSLLRGVILGAFLATGIGLIILSTVMVLQTRRQGWHDRAADSVVIGERQLAPPTPKKQQAARSADDESEPVGTRSMHGDRVDLVEETAGESTESSEERLPDPDQYWAERRQQDRQRHELGEQRADQNGAVEGPEPVERPQHLEDRSTGDQDPAAATAGVHTDNADDSADELAADEGWVIILEDGREIAVQRLVLVGRNPQPQRGEGDARLIKIMDESRTVSKTHLSVSVDAQGIAVTDRRSTNGSALTAPDGTYELLTPDQPRRLREPGYLVSFGKHHIRIGRRT